MCAPLQVHHYKAGAVASLRIARNLEDFDSNDVARSVDVVTAIIPHGASLLATSGRMLAGRVALPLFGNEVPHYA
jgi:hypothetical protein